VLARQKADELSLSISNSVQKLDAIIEKEKISSFGWQRVIGGQAPTGDVDAEEKKHSDTILKIQSDSTLNEMYASSDALRKQIAEKRLADMEAENTRFIKAIEVLRKNDQDLENKRNAALSAPTTAYSFPSFGVFDPDTAAAAQYADNGVPTLSRAKKIQEEVGLEADANQQNQMVEAGKKTPGKDAQVASLEAVKRSKEAYDELNKVLQEQRDKLQGAANELRTLTPLQLADSKAKTEATQIIDRLTAMLKDHGITIEKNARVLKAFQDIRADTQGAAELELQRATNEEYKKAIDGINEKIESYKRLTAAIHQSYEEQANAYALEARNKAAASGRLSPAQLDAVQAGSKQEFYAQHDSKTGEDVQKITDHTAILNAEASATLRGSEAVRQFALDQKILNETKGKSAEQSKLISDALTAEASAQEKLKTDELIAKLNLETAAQQRLNAARLQGADAVRAAQLGNQIAAIKSNTAPGAEQNKLIADTQVQAQLAEQTRLLDLASQVDYSNKQKLGDLDKQLALMKEIGASELAVKEVENERTKLLDTIALQTGSMADVLRATFDKMAAQASQIREQISEAVMQLQNGVNSQIAKLATGQKTDWSKMFQGQAEGLMKTGLGDIEGSILGKFGFGGKHDGSTEANALYVRIAGGGGAKVGAILGSDTGGLTGQGLLGDADSSGGFTGFLGKLAHFAGFFAAGGDLPANSFGIVGEAGPELIHSGSRGLHVTPNHALGGNSTYYTIDARGASSADMEARLQKALVEVHGSAVRASVAVQAEMAKRRPRF
jgi:hypothetical protein